jgi:hypothetical protein
MVKQQELCGKFSIKKIFKKNFLIIYLRTPPLRESFSFPFHVIQLFVVTYVLQQQQTLMNTDTIKSLTRYLKKQDVPMSIDLQQNSISYRRKLQLVLLLSGSTILYMLPWQCKFDLFVEYLYSMS